MDDKDLEVEALESELDAALRKLFSVLVLGKDVNEAAWWLCANHGMFLLNYEHSSLMSGCKLNVLIDMAKKSGNPPSNSEKTWEDWFARLRQIRESRQGL